MPFQNRSFALCLQCRPLLTVSIKQTPDGYLNVLYILFPDLYGKIAGWKVAGMRIGVVKNRIAKFFRHVQTTKRIAIAASNEVSYNIYTHETIPLHLTSVSNHCYFEC